MATNYAPRYKSWPPTGYTAPTDEEFTELLRVARRTCRTGMFAGQWAKIPDAEALRHLQLMPVLPDADRNSADVYDYARELRRELGRRGLASPVPIGILRAVLERPGRGGRRMNALRRPRVLDLCCCAGGAGMGYWRAGFDVVGVDLEPRPNYPFTFVQGDALEFMRKHCQEFHLVHSSPPCQSQCTLTKGTNQGRTYVDLIPEMRELCLWYGVDWTMENVNGAALRKDLTLCGEMFGLGVIRHRHFELGWLGCRPVQGPKHVRHRGPVRGWRHGVYRDGPYIAAYGKGGGKGSVTEMQRAMGITWTDVHEELTEAIPPAYTEWIGREWIRRGEWNARLEPDTDQRLARLRRTGMDTAA